jgi:radical SAM protein with 4Fe4S-binding SPASM domain
VVEGVGADVIELCDGRRTGQDIANHIAASYGADPRQVEQDVVRYLASLQETGFLREQSLEAADPADNRLLGIAVHVTGRCQLACRHCYASPTSAAQPDPPIELIVSAVQQARALGAGAVKVTGGDPLCRPEVLDALVEPARGAEVTVFTNGVAGADELTRQVLDRGWKLQISLDGAEAATHDANRGAGAHTRLTAALAEIAARGMAGSVTLSVCLSRLNVREVEPIVRQAVEWGCAGVHLVRISRQGRAVDFWEEASLSDEEWVEAYRGLADTEARYRDRLKLTGFLLDYVRSCVARPATRGCGLGRQVMMDLDGNVYPCIMVTTPEACLGNLQTESLADCLAPERLTGLRQACGERLTDAAVCGACDWRMICRGACPGWPLVQDGTLSGTDGLCDLRRELFRRAIFELARETPCPK